MLSDSFTGIKIRAEKYDPHHRLLFALGFFYFLAKLSRRVCTTRSIFFVFWPSSQTIFTNRPLAKRIAFLDPGGRQGSWRRGNTSRHYKPWRRPLGPEAQIVSPGHLSKSFSRKVKKQKVRLRGYFLMWGFCVTC